jgi:hypothetical protein
MTKLRGVGIGFVFLVGCAVGGASSRFVVPPADAQQVGTGARWEHFCVWNADVARVVTTQANEAGSQGWEMVAVGGATNSIWCFKRPGR